MISKLHNWLDHRAGYKRFIDALLLEHIPGGAKWRYVWGSCLAFVFAVQLITGILLMTAYSAGDSTAWSSVYFIQYQMDFGWFLRGLHHFGSQVMVVLLAIHMLQVVIAGAHLPPREINWWLGLALLGAVLALSLTGYLLPWDQKGYWATQVATNIAGNLPVAGSFLQKVVVGGPVYGHHTLTRFYALHVGVLPPLVILLIVLHLVVFRRHGVTVPLVTRPMDEEGESLVTAQEKDKEGWFWPDQAFRDMVASMIIFGVLIGLVLWGHGHKVESPQAPEGRQGLYDYWAHAGRDGRGANLDAPADSSVPYPARPEWYFLFLFQLLKYFEGEKEIIGTVVIPQAVLVLLALLPLLGHGRMRKFGHGFGVLVVVGILTGAVALTLLALAADTVYPLSRALITLVAMRVVPLIALVFLLQLGVLSLLGQGRLRTSVYAVGILLLAALFLGTGALTYEAMAKDREYVEAQEKKQPFAAWSAGNAPAGEAVLKPAFDAVEKQMTETDKKPPDDALKFQQERAQADVRAERVLALAGSGIPEQGGRYLLRRDPLTQGPKLFESNCATCHTYGDRIKNDKASASDLADFGTAAWVSGLLKEPDSPHYFGRTGLNQMSNWVKKHRTKLAPDLEQIAQWLGSHPRGPVPDEKDQSDFARGYRAFDKRQGCTECHSYKDMGGGSAGAPDFTGYGDAGWVRLMIMAPNSELRYGKRNKMPAFRDLEGPTAEITRDEWNRKKEALLAEVTGEGEAADKQKTAIEEAHKLVNLSDVDRELIIRWLLKDDRVVFGGDPIAAAPKSKP